jgi:hypothetical protein
MEQNKDYLEATSTWNDLLKQQQQMTMVKHNYQKYVFAFVDFF